MQVINLDDYRDCPFGYKVPDDIISYSVPEHLRERIAAVVAARESLVIFRPKPGIHGETWYQSAKRIFEESESIENELRHMVEAPRASYVEFYAGWRFRCLDQQTLRAEYLAQLDKK